MSVKYRKAWEVIAFTRDGAVICLDCAADERERFWNDEPVSGERPAPVFVSDELWPRADDGMTTGPVCCDICRDTIWID